MNQGLNRDIYTHDFFEECYKLKIANLSFVVCINSSEYHFLGYSNNFATFYEPQCGKIEPVILELLLPWKSFDPSSDIIQIV